MNSQNTKILTEETNILMAKFYLGGNSPRDYADWATLCLENGLDTKTICILASMFDANAFSDIDIYFERALNDIGLTLLPKQESLINYSKVIAKQIIENKITPIEGCRKIYKLIYDLDHVGNLSNWMYLDEGLDPKTYNFLWDSYSGKEPTREIQNAIIREAKELLEDNSYFS